jgi:hypothetical protein
MWPGVPAIIVVRCKEKQYYLLIFYPCFGRMRAAISDKPQLRRMLTFHRKKMPVRSILITYLLVISPAV